MSASAIESSRFAVYCGDGHYLAEFSQVHHNAPRQRRGVPATVVEASTGPLERALQLSRREAVGALHAVRRAGLSAWLVLHPEAVGGVAA